MPVLIKNIDAIAREKKRDVLYLVFHEKLFQHASDDNPFPDFDYHIYGPRIEIIDWLTTNNIEFYPTGDVAREYSIVPYLGQLYIDVPFDEGDSTYQKLFAHLENQDGSMKIDGIGFCYFPLEHALRNAHHDEPGFWEKHYENF